jgi:hypothetical protein
LRRLSVDMTMRKEEDQGEDASATVELAILVPVYLLLTVMLLTIGQLVIVRQEVVLGARYKAWLPGKAKGDDFITRSFFGKLASYGRFESKDIANEPITFGESDLALDARAKARITGDQSGLEGATARLLALAAMNDQVSPSRHLARSSTTGTFAYSAPWLPYAVTPRATSLVYSRVQPAERKVYRGPGGGPDAVPDHVPIEDYLVDPSTEFSISKDNRYFPPTAPDPNNPNEAGMSLDPPMSSSGVGDPGIWNTGFRLGGDVSSERDFFKKMLGF